MFTNITLEVSLKPFKQTDEKYIREVCNSIYEQWRPLLKNRESISLMLWSSDGSELLDYAGNLNDEFEWCKYVGTANKPLLGENEPKETSLHQRKQFYMQDPPRFTYATLKTIVYCLKTEGKKHFPTANIRIGATFDIGPEFAVSEFKYKRHPEICTGANIGGFGFVDATAVLNGDKRRYAAYPDGIPEGTPFGTFLGKQAAVFLPAMGFDYLWLSNGLGFSSNPWDITGKLFDGERYYPNRLPVTKEKVFAFWKLFRAECDLPLETRGTNNSAGIDYATDGVPLYDIYKAGLNITPPPNSPWAAINDNFGLEIMGHMTRICELPQGKVVPFRYYLHDPWWVNSPWQDRYDGEPSDIYLPMSISRIKENGEVETAGSLNILSIDNSFGEMPDACAVEAIPHILKAEKHAADEPAPLVWVYPMREYTTTTDEKLLAEMNLGDRFICNAINQGLPLCCVVSSDLFLAQDFSVYKNSILITPVPEKPELLKRLLAYAEQGGVIVYGSEERLSMLPETQNIEKIVLSDSPQKVLAGLECFGYFIRHICKPTAKKPPTMAVSKSNNAWYFSAYNCDTTTDTYLKFPLGAPILSGRETEIENGFAHYRFSRCEHRECRVFVQQNDGVISMREAAPVNMRYRRRLRIGGLKDATVYIFPEKGCEQSTILSEREPDETPCVDPRFVVLQDEKYGVYLKGENITGNFYVNMEKKMK